MRLPFLARGPDGDDHQRRRATSLLLVVAIHLLLLLMLLRLAPPFAFVPPPPSLKLFRIPPPPEPQADTHDKHRTTKGAAKAPGGAPPKSAPTAPAPNPAPAAQPWVINPALQGFNLTQMPVHAPPSPSPSTTATAGTGTGAQAGDSPGAGTGPGGEQLYAVDWYRHPTNAELSTYLPKDRRVSGWGEIACKTIERFHVDDCVELGQSPPGSGLSRAVREAAFQFLVRPPRIGGKSLVGTWVRIRISYGIEDKEER